MTKNPKSEMRNEILKWMNYGIPRGKTIPVFEEMLDKYEELIKTINIGSSEISTRTLD